MVAIQTLTCFCGSRYKVVSEVKRFDEHTKFVCSKCEMELNIEGMIESVQIELEPGRWTHVQPQEAARAATALKASTR